jgi:hypothetical protein
MATRAGARASWSRWGVAVLSALVAAGPVSASSPRGEVVGGGDDPSVVQVQTPGDMAVTRWKQDVAASLRAATEAAARPAPGAGGGPSPDVLAPDCWWACPPVLYALESYARQQITSYYCGPAAAQVIVNRSRGVASPNVDGEKSATNYRRQSVIGSFMGTTTNGSSAWMVKSGLNQYADLGASGQSVPFTVVEAISSGSDFHWAMVTATWTLQRGAAVPIEMTFDGQHLASWSSSAWWNNHRTWTIRHWISIYGYDGLWDGTAGPQLLFTDSAGGLGGQTGNFQNASKLIYNLNQANSARIVY